MKYAFQFDMGVEGKPENSIGLLAVLWSSNRLKALTKVTNPFQLNGKFESLGPVASLVFKPRWVGVGLDQLLREGQITRVACADSPPPYVDNFAWLDENEHFAKSLGFGSLRLMKTNA